MKKIDIKIRITSSDSDMSYNTIGEFKNQRIKFVDKENDINYVILHKDIVEYYKKGNIDMKYKFDLDSVTKGYYTVLHNKFEFDIVTNLLEVNEGSIRIKYDLYQSSELVNQTELVLTYEFEEEF